MNANKYEYVYISAQHLKGFVCEQFSAYVGFISDGNSALSICRLRVDGQCCVVDHGNDSNRHVGPHDVGVSHAKEQHESHEVTGAEATCDKERDQTLVKLTETKRT